MKIIKNNSTETYSELTSSRISKLKRLLVVHKMSSLNLAKERLIIFSDRVDWVGSAYYLK
jgi:hypothetical protein